MKKSDIAMIILIASMCALIAFLIAGQLPFLKVDSKGVSVPHTDNIDSEVAQPDTTVFNKDAINPTVQTVIGGSGAAQ